MITRIRCKRCGVEMSQKHLNLGVADHILRHTILYVSLTAWAATFIGSHRCTSITDVEEPAGY